MPDFSIENEISKSINKKNCIIVGVDEVGYGSLAGPVVSAASFFLRHDNEIIYNIKDSKKLTPKKRIEVYNTITSIVKWSIGFADVYEIDQHNILNATHLAMQRALNGLNCDIDYVIVDGNKVPDLPWNRKAIVDGDNISVSIAAASIIAKVTRDKLMETLHTQYPEYQWNKNKGYGTKHHLESLYKYGKTIHHRNTFAPLPGITKLYSK
ncbi:ribonuclease HII [Ehrlichia canis]|uniref:Ribonuclease HII n=1 Tax=Ehrlichia canis (strain Jake) TaxID=269484 RepID=RNH2_EHRCJ|nr:ribonuclease HII [Ehrlichia canis]Q3YST1.1 RecName: Full=Ribonuclease HII; Short=RNase HII [Ehrlichia canis str. Jake]AAZ68224.1 Ribonuclease H [Ehrlichia canis str. Jake]AUO55011.1 ribonuclease HII [Ehrlichia canis]UKC53557.1 ribonuclease HII [Ehrlichia canis]UKC54495.1 ribonuclease HII [Ehrlichia canis]UKC55431.1 ribonuclease HII [Ehrlichia canis]